MSADPIPPALRLFAVVVLLGLLAWLIVLVRHHRLSLRDSLLWLLSTCAALLVALFPRILVWTARVLQVEVPSNALFALTFLYVLGNLLSITIALSSTSARTRRLTQECALLRAELQLLRREQSGAGAPAPGEPG